MFRFQSSAPKAPQHSHCKVKKSTKTHSTRTHWNKLPQLTRANDNTGGEWECDSTKQCPHIFLGEVYQVLQINVVSVGPNVVVNEKVQLVLDPVFEDKGQDSCSQLQEEDDAQEHRELKDPNVHSCVKLQSSPQRGQFEVPTLSGDVQISARKSFLAVRQCNRQIQGWTSPRPPPGRARLGQNPQGPWWMRCWRGRPSSKQRKTK